jgi:hypothetical protein
MSDMFVARLIVNFVKVQLKHSQLNFLIVRAFEGTESGNSITGGLREARQCAVSARSSNHWGDRRNISAFAE